MNYKKTTKFTNYEKTLINTIKNLRNGLNDDKTLEQQLIEEELYTALNNIKLKKPIKKTNFFQNPVYK